MGESYNISYKLTQVKDTPELKSLFPEEHIEDIKKIN